MIKFCVLLLAVAVAIPCLGQEIQKIEVVIAPSLKEKGEMPYSPTPITWDEFKGSPDRNSEFIAMTYSGIKIKYEYRTRKGVTEAKVHLCPYMDINQSWFKPEGHNDPTLAHEQRHFDITAVVARQFAEELKKRKFTVQSFPSEIKLLHKEYIDKLAEMQQQYDEETEHGIKPDKQAMWDKRLAEEVRKAMAES